MICLVRDKKIPFAGFPIDVKNVDVIGCKASNQIKNKKIRKKRTPNSKYSGLPFQIVQENLSWKNLKQYKRNNRNDNS